ncbi:MAG: hypothetical protein HFG73_00540 [Hungatella sp.]|nr:hypothetical protein [Hungatella sp.]
MEKKQSSFLVAFPVSSVYFGALVGPSMVSGAFAAVYFAPYGAWGLVLPLVTMGLAAFIVTCGMIGISRWKVYDYSSYARKLYGPLSPVLSPLLEIFLVLAMIVGGSSVIAMGGTFFNSLLGMPVFLGAVLMALISSLLVLWGANLVRKSSTFMTIVLVVGFFLLVVFAAGTKAQRLSAIISRWETPAGIGFLSGVVPALSLGLSHASNALTLSSVSQNILTRKDAVMVGLISFVLNSSAFIACTVLILPYCPEALAESVPNLYIINTFLIERVPWLPVVYSVVMFFGLASSGAPQLHAVASRVLPLYPASWKMKDLTKNIISSVIYMTVCIAISFLGLRTIISAGYGLLGSLAVPLIVIPLCIVMPVRLYKERSLKND